MLDQLSDRLPHYVLLGDGRNEDGSGEHVAILVKSQSHSVAEYGQFWISPYPEVPGSCAWGADLPRICTWASLQDAATGHLHFVFNVHLDNRSGHARLEGTGLMRRRIRNVSKKQNNQGTGRTLVPGTLRFHPSSWPEISMQRPTLARLQNCARMKNWP